MKTWLLAAVISVAVTTSATALTFNWSFQPSNAPTQITGTISGLNEGVNSGAGLVVTVDSSLNPAQQRADYIFQASALGTPFVVTGGRVTVADALFLVLDGNLEHIVSFGYSGGFFPNTVTLDLRDGSLHDNAYTDAASTVFSPLATPEPTSLAALGSAAMLIAFARRRRAR